MSVIGSDLLTPNSSEATRPEAATASGIPIATPTVVRIGADRDADANLARAPGDRIGEQGIHPDKCEQRGNRRYRDRKRRAQPFTRGTRSSLCRSGTISC